MPLLAFPVYMNEFHHLLEEQIRRYLGPAGEIPDHMLPLLQAVSLRYEQQDRELELTERSVELGTQSLAERARRLENSNQELKRFAYVAAHDLREPLRSISGFIQLLERREVFQSLDLRDLIGAES